MKLNRLFLIFLFTTTVVLCFGFFQTTSFAQEAYLEKELSYESGLDSGKALEDLKLPSVGQVAVKMASVLVFVLALMFGILFLVQKFFHFQKPDNENSQENIRVLSYRRFDAKRGVYLIEVLGKVLVVGADVEGLHTLAEITDTEKVNEARQMDDIQTEIVQLNPFQNMLDGMTQPYLRDRVKQKKEKNTRSVIERIDQLKQRLS